MPHTIIALIIASIVGGVLAYPSVVAIEQSTLSTAAIGYVLLPISVAPVIILILLIYYSFLLAKRRFQSGIKRQGLFYLLIGLSLFVGGILYIEKEYITSRADSQKIAAIIAPISEMNHEGITSLIDRYPSFPEMSGQRIFILNALLEREDLTSEELDKISRIKDQSIHDKLYSNSGLLGKNKKGLSVARLIAYHPNVSPSTLRFLGAVDEPYLQGSVASNLKTPIELLEGLYNKSKNNKNGYLIEWGLAQNKNTPLPILKELRLSSNEYTKSYAERTLESIK